MRTRRGRGVFSSHGCGQRGGRAALAGDAGGFLVSGAAEKRPWVLVEMLLVLRRVHPRAGKGGTRSCRNPLVEQRAADEEVDRRGAAPGGAAAGASPEPGEERGVPASPAAGQSGGR